MVRSEAGKIHLESCSINQVPVKEGFIPGVMEGRLVLQWKYCGP